MEKVFSLYDNQLTPKRIEPMTSFLIRSKKKLTNPETIVTSKLQHKSTMLFLWD